MDRKVAVGPKVAELAEGDAGGDVLEVADGRDGDGPVGRAAKPVPLAGTCGGPKPALTIVWFVRACALPDASASNLQCVSV